MRMDTWKLLALVLAIALACGGLTAYGEETAAVYKLGDKVEDFTVTMTDGQEISLYGLLAEKKAVLLNFWASWCGPCKMEFPYLQETYDKLSAEVGMIALSVNEGDTVEIIEKLKAELGVTTVPTGRDIGLAVQYDVHAYPTSIVIDRNGVICLIHEGMVTSSRILENALAAFIADDYEKPLLLTELPNLPVTQAPNADKLSAALNGEGGTLDFLCAQSEEAIWPFEPAEDGKSAVAANVNVQNSTANVVTELNVKAGDVLTYDVRMNGVEYDDRLVVFVDQDMYTLHTASFDWTTYAIRFDADAVKMIAFAYARGSHAGYEAACELRNIRLLTGEEAAAYEMPVDAAPKTLPGSEIALDFADPASIQAVYAMDEKGDRLYDTPIAYIANSDAADLRLRIGADVNENFAGLSLVYDMTDQKNVMLSGLKHDDEAYLYTVDLTVAEVSTSVVFSGNRLDAAQGNTTINLCRAPENFKGFALQLYAFMQSVQGDAEEVTYPNYAFAYEDGTTIVDYDTIAAEVAAQKQAEAAGTQTPSFTITFTDAAGTPVPGVMAQICDDATCTVLPSDENGVVKFDGENHSYELHVLMAPAGYEAPTDVITLPANGGALSIALDTVAP